LPCSGARRAANGIVARVGRSEPVRVYHSKVLQIVGETRLALPIVAR
jgi:hypothetical protein